MKINVHNLLVFPHELECGECLSECGESELEFIRVFNNGLGQIGFYKDYPLYNGKTDFYLSVGAYFEREIFVTI